MNLVLSESPKKKNNTLTNECRILERFYSHVQVRLTYRRRLQNKSPIYEGLYTKTRTKQGCKSSVQY